MSLPDKAKEITLNNFKRFNRYDCFLNECTLTEFAQSQIPFYHAVNAFPRALCYLGSMIERSDIRLKIAENIWEEHGNGEPRKFHIETFHQYLTAIAGNDYKLTKNPWIEEWIKGWFCAKTPFELASKLAAIEYLYAPISNVLSNHLEKFDLNNEQSHYQKHSELDWEHGRELLEIAINYDDSIENERFFEIFNTAQLEFIFVFNSMIVMTQKKVNDIALDDIAFYYLREDPSIASALVDDINNKPVKNIISICSGGEGIMEYLCHSDALEIIALDMNKNQYDLLQYKLNAIMNDSYSNHQLNKGKFERIFVCLRDFFNEKEKDDFLTKNHLDIEKLKYAIDNIFTRENLSTIFTENAVKYTKKDFAEHFLKVFSKKFESGSFGEKNIKNILAGEYIHHRNKDEFKLENKKISPLITNVKNIDFYNEINFNNGLKTDLIDLSNIGDWLDISTLISIIDGAFENLSDGGIIIIRKLLGDYDLFKLIENSGFKATKKHDSSGFYEEVVVGYKS
ncbi:iron-containing redox enzyme family protein [Xenorhabdus innexi]|uniref:Uncharacterized protein n=1 Tax=Xenorhabdus innexi TaxID=290109 RepID=A0A1N6MTX8_9GAMM|nr:iron-containing redox enzyme family protein [Xenorhabdus innexi]PHM27981.1 hypothetical protein Xinn_03895 [Xenorhabdus innexi]SIP72247.1 hypothetical protein XIS1_140003 [Xenorhabdus innexi]